VDSAAAVVSPAYSTGASEESVRRRWLDHHDELYRRR
jgi:hypothetical protein